MKSLFMALVLGVSLGFLANSAKAECYPIEKAKADVAVWDANAEWVFLTEGPKYDAVIKWLKTQNAYVEGADGIVITYATGKAGSMIEGPMVLFAQTVGGKCAETASLQVMSAVQFEDVIGQVV
jgi:hypothetical protein